MNRLNALFAAITLRIQPIRIVLIGYLSYVVLGTLFLSLDCAHAPDKDIAVIDALFTATSAVSTTGLATLNTGTDFNFLGQAIILLLIQLGGIGYMTFTSFICLTKSTQLSIPQKKIAKSVFALSEGIQLEHFLKSVLLFTIVIESVGALLLYFEFKSLGVATPLWSAIFHSISAFCTAGFSLYGTSLEAFRGNFTINFVIGVLCYSGAIGFIVFIDFWNCLIGKTKRITLTSKIILVATFWIASIATFLIFIQESSIQALPPAERLMTALFQVTNASTTAGFNSIPLGTCSMATLFLLVIVMIIGASPAGTGGGIKTTTFSALWGVLKSHFNHQNKVTFWEKEIPESRIRSAVSIFFFYIIMLFSGCYLLTLTEKENFLSLLFETSSAIGTVGLSTGITASLSTMGKIIITFMMFIGRLGPLAFGVALFYQRQPTASKEDIAL